MGLKCPEHAGKVVEAAGVEPASEGTYQQASTCVAALEYSQLPSKSDANRQPPAPKRLIVAVRDSRRQPACLMASDPQPPGQAKADVTAY